MPGRKKKLDPKAEALREHGALHPRPEDVREPVFADSDFFDPRDLVQVKYEMLRCVRVEGCPVTDASTRFGLSRPTYYAAKAGFDREGIIGLLPRKRGPRGAHKLTDEVMDFVEAELGETPALRSDDLVSRIEEHFGRRVHSRTVERGLARRKKKLR